MRDSILIDGPAELARMVHRAGYASVAHAVAELTVFVHPDTVRQTGNAPVFRAVRGDKKNGRGTILDHHDGGRVIADDNRLPVTAFLWATRARYSPDVQVNHIWDAVEGVGVYSALWNLCVTPSFLGQATDSDSNTRLALRVRAWELYGPLPGVGTAPATPAWFHELRWRAHPEPVTDIGADFQRQILGTRSGRVPDCVRECGWFLSDHRPDPTVGRVIVRPGTAGPRPPASATG